MCEEQNAGLVIRGNLVFSDVDGEPRAMGTRVRRKMNRQGL